MPNPVEEIFHVEAGYRYDADDRLGPGEFPDYIFRLDAALFFPYTQLNILPAYYLLARCTSCGYVQPFQKEGQREWEVVDGHRCCAICSKLFCRAREPAATPEPTPVYLRMEGESVSLDHFLLGLEVERLLAFLM